MLEGNDERVYGYRWNTFINQHNSSLRERCERSCTMTQIGHLKGMRDKQHN